MPPDLFELEHFSYPDFFQNNFPFSPKTPPLFGVLSIAAQYFLNYSSNERRFPELLHLEESERATERENVSSDCVYESERDRASVLHSLGFNNTPSQCGAYVKPAISDLMI